MNVEARRSRSFPPVSDPATARILVLGSMPGQASLGAGRYYAHPRNQFWPIMGALCGAGPALPYDARLEALKRAGIALWDVLESCERAGSLDADIDPRSVRINDFAAFFDRHSGIERILFNGATAARLFDRAVRPHLPVRVPERLQLPSTSPAHAGMRFEEKLSRWRAALQPAALPAVTNCACQYNLK